MCLIVDTVVPFHKYKLTQNTFKLLLLDGVIETKMDHYVLPNLEIRLCYLGNIFKSGYDLCTYYLFFIASYLINNKKY